MKKILVSFATLAVISSSIMTTTAWVKNKQHIQTKDPDHQLSRDASYSDLDFGNFQSVMHPFSFQKLDPTIADVNYNLYSSQSDVYSAIAVYLDQRLLVYFARWGFVPDNTILEDNINENSLGTNFNIIDQNTGKEWVPPTLQSGQYECYNLELVNLLSHTSFTFSLNYCDFDLNDIIKPINATPNVNNISDSVYSGDASHIFSWNNNPQPYTTFNLSSYLQNINQNATWPNPIDDPDRDYLLKIDNYFMNSITWRWNSDLSIGYNERLFPGEGWETTCQLFDNSDQGGYNSQINYQMDKNDKGHNGIVKPVSPPLKGGGVWSNKWESNTLAENRGNQNGSLQEYEGDRGWAATSEMYNVWNMNGDTHHEESSDWDQDIQDLLYIDQFWTGSSNNEINFAPFIGGFSNIDEWPYGQFPWDLQWNFQTTEMETSYKDVFSQASAYQVTGLEDYSTFMTYKDPNKILKNYSVPLDSSNGINEIYDLYDSAQTVTFNSNYLTSASVDYQSVALDKPYTINQGSHVVDVRFNDPQIAKEYAGNYNEGALEFHMDIQNDYDFSQGVDASTLNKTNEVDSYGDTIYNVDVYMKGKSASQLSKYINPGGQKDRKPVFKVLSSPLFIKNPPWQNVLNSGENLADGIAQYGNTISDKKQGQDTDLNNFLSGYDPISADQSILGWGGEEESSSYRTGLTNRMNAIDGSESQYLKGIMFHFVVSWDGGAWHCQNFDKRETIGTQYLNAYNAIVEPQLINPVKAITPSTPKESALTPSNPSGAQQIANELKGKVIVLDPKYWVGKDIKNYKEQLDNVLVAEHILTKDEVQYVSWGDLTLKKGMGTCKCDFTVTKDGHTVVDHDTEIQFNTRALFHWLNVGFEQGIMKEEEGELQYIGATPPYGSIDTSNPTVMQNLVSSIWKDPAIVHGYYNSDFFKEYSRYISFDKTKLTNGGKIMMHIKVGSYTKDYQIKVWWRTAS